MVLVIKKIKKCAKTIFNNLVIIFHILVNIS